MKLKKLLLLLLLAATARADGPLSRFKDTDTDQEFVNVYDSIRNPVIQSGKANVLNVKSLSVSTITYVSSATVSNLTVTNINGAAYSAVTAGQLPATATNDDAAAGKVGEVRRSIVASGSRVNLPATGTFGNITSVAITAGDWDVTGQVLLVLNGATMTSWAIATSKNSADTQTDHEPPENDTTNVGPPPTATYSMFATIAGWRISISGPETVYLKCRGNFSAGTPQAAGKITVRRMR